jgi:hypothetical protein
VGYYVQGKIEGVVSMVCWTSIDRVEASKRAMSKFPDGFTLYRFTDFNDKSSFEAIQTYTPQGIPGLL